jgi:putative hydrolase of the HAD superfamily
MMPNPPKFIYFDLGNVLINFSHRRAAEQMAVASGSTTEFVWQMVFEGPLQTRLETGQLDSHSFCREFREATGSQVADDRLLHAASDIFWLNAPIVPIVGQLAAAGFPLGLLSNTCQAHWEFVWRKFALLHIFPVRLLSFEFGAMKPAASFFRAAIDAAGCKRTQIFCRRRPNIIYMPCLAASMPYLYDGARSGSTVVQSRRKFQLLMPREYGTRHLAPAAVPL